MHSCTLDTPANVGDTVALSADEAKHALRVLRMSEGDEVNAVDPEGRRFLAVLTDVTKDTASVRLTEALPDNEAPVRVTLYQGFPKADKLDLITQKVTELGAACVVPVLMERSVVKLDGKDAEKRRERLDRIAREAQKQCRRGVAPEIVTPMPWKAALERIAKHALVLVPWENAEGTRMHDIREEFPDADDIAVLIGPEGGISEKEIAQLEALGARTVTLGPRILRAETAALASVTMAMTLWGDL